MKPSKRCFSCVPNGKDALYFFSTSSNVSLFFIMFENKYLGFVFLTKCMCVFECKDIKYLNI